jgi:hypothetical protein
MNPAARPSLAQRWEALGRSFPHLPFPAAALVLVLLAAAMAWSALASLGDHRPPSVPGSAAAEASPALQSAPTPARGDMALYARIARRVAAGEGYYAAALGEQRASAYPTRPFVAVRLPTLALLQARIGVDAVRWLALALVGTAIAALNWRAVPLASLGERIIASALLAAGDGAALVPVAGYDHDFIAGVLLTVALLAYRPERWWPALLAAAAALAVRELAAPFVLLWLAVAVWQHRWREAAAVAGLLAIFACGLALHAQAVEAARLPGDLASQGWNARAGFGLPLRALGQLTGLRFVPLEIAALLAILPLIGWAALGGRTGLFAAVWFAGIATMMALFARPANSYWAELVLPAYAAGLAFAPRAQSELVGRLARTT